LGQECRGCRAAREEVRDRALVRECRVAKDESPVKVLDLAKDLDRARLPDKGSALECLQALECPPAKTSAKVCRRCLPDKDLGPGCHPKAWPRECPECPLEECRASVRECLECLLWLREWDPAR
jgi:hypothetical protein